MAAKSYFGNLGAGSGMVELIASLLAMQHGRLFPQLNYETPDPECPVAVVADGAIAGGREFHQPQRHAAGPGQRGAGPPLGTLDRVAQARRDGRWVRLMSGQRAGPTGSVTIPDGRWPAPAPPRSALPSELGSSGSRRGKVAPERSATPLTLAIRPVCLPDYQAR